jgi:hypothetical protein
MTLSYQILESIRNTDEVFGYCYDELFPDTEYPYEDDEYCSHSLPTILEDRANSYIMEEEEIHFGELLECVLEFCVERLVETAMSREKEDNMHEILRRFSDEWTFEIAVNLRNYLVAKKITFVDDRGIVINNPQNCLFNFERSLYYVYG